MKIALIMWGQYPWLLALVCANFVDILTGFAKAYIWKKVDSSVTFRGVTKKILVWIVLGLLQLFNQVFPGFNMMQIGASFYLLWEMQSIIENLAEMGVPIPRGVVEAIAANKRSVGQQALPKEINEILTGDATKGGDDGKVGP